MRALGWLLSSDQQPQSFFGAELVLLTRQSQVTEIKNILVVK